MSSDLQARQSLEALVRHVLVHQNEPVPGITYEELATRIGRLNKHAVPWARGMGSVVLKKMGHLLKGVSVGWGEPIPDIQCLAVLKNGPNKGLPDDGIKEFWPEYPKLTRSEKEIHVEAQRKRVMEFGSRWNMVLRYLNLPEIRPESVFGRVFGAGGESPAHKALKEFVKSHPGLFGVDASAEALTEYALPSLDTVDVLFKTPACWTAVEVKSSVSDGVSGDYERGLYQTVKYSAILEAMKRDSRFLTPPTTNVVLVLQSKLPANLRTLKSALQVRLFENVEPQQHI